MRLIADSARLVVDSGASCSERMDILVPDLLHPMKLEKDNLLSDKAGGSGSADHSFGDDLTILELDEGKRSLDATKKCRRSYQLNRHFKDTGQQRCPGQRWSLEKMAP